MHAVFMRRCFDLARLGAGRVSPNPLVGAVLVYEGKIIGEGWHRRYGEAHAEVNAVQSVAPEHRALIPHATLYCSLEPCFHHGKTPPCVDLILRENIRKVVISCTDPNPLVAGQSVKKLTQAGVGVLTGILESEGKALNRPFFKWIRTRRPFVVLKWARSSDGFIGKKGERTPVSGLAALRLGHRWRAESDAILVGTTTALIDNPRLDTRLWPGPSPLRIAIDQRGKLPGTHHLLDDARPTWIVGQTREGTWQQTQFFPSDKGEVIPRLLDRLAEANKAILLVEGGATTLQRFLDEGRWDEIRILENKRRLGEGIREPALPAARLAEEQVLGQDRYLRYWPETDAY
ncbi:MAG TPA: bifunctional diaminohydroxyphosphoribosylaminopyrimidine deaminase/5-amino-6-(5-phosphoribosylamino)uracil reductase RibD [Saprospiraceae bacterium]|nr:bifunctional diaminohydroxyphosphoribosylaminopyrimidine deaminase/5-amino-6-(5-phosphoribosylamino)uracil reductase RibD [Saprospiraceae bacterium]